MKNIKLPNLFPSLFLVLIFLPLSMPGQAVNVKVAAVHFKPVLKDVDGNLQKMSALAEEAGKNNAKIVVFPEMATSGYSFFSRSEIRAVAETVPGKTTGILGKIARRYKLYLEVGLPEIDKSTNRFYNSAVLIGPSGEIVGVYRKRSQLLESSWVSIGEGVPQTFQTPYGRLGMVICADLFLPELSRLAALAKADILLAPANTGVDLDFLQVRAVENNFHLILSNRYGAENQGVKTDVFTQETMIIPTPFAYNFDFGSRSAIVTSDGDVKTNIEEKRDQVGYAELAIPKKHEFPVNRRPELYSFLGQDTLEPYTFSQLGLAKPQKFDAAAIDPGPVASAGDLYGAIRTSVSKAGDMASSKQQVLKVAVFPANFLTESSTSHVNVPALQTIAKDLNVDLAIGVSEQENGKYYSSTLFITKDKDPVKYRRTHRSNSEQIATGENFIVIDRDYGRISLLQAQDLVAPETSRVMAKMGVDLVLVSADLNMPLLNPMVRTRTGDYLHIAMANKKGIEAIYLGGFIANPLTVEQEGLALIEMNTGDIRNKKELRRVDGWDILLRVP